MDFQHNETCREAVVIKVTENVYLLIVNKREIEISCTMDLHYAHENKGDIVRLHDEVVLLVTLLVN